MATAEGSRPRLVVVTGGPGSGKTTLVEALAERGLATVPEAAIEIIAELNEELGLEGQKSWRRANLARFQELVMDRQVAREEEALASGAGVVVLDRGRLDGLAYCRHFGTEVPAGVVARARAARYDAVFVLDTLGDEAFDRGATGRTSDRATSLALRELVEAVYREAGLEPIRVPVAPVEERVDRVQGAIAALRATAEG